MTHETFYKIRYDHGTQKVIISEHIGNMSVYHSSMKSYGRRIQTSALEYCSTLESAQKIAKELFNKNFMEEVQRNIDNFNICIQVLKNKKNFFNFSKLNKEITKFEEKILKEKNKKEEEHQNNIVINLIPHCLDLNKIIKDDQPVYIVNNYINKASQNAYQEKIKSSIVYKEGKKCKVSYILYDLTEDKYSGEFELENIHESEILIPGYSAKAFLEKKDANSYCQEKINELETAKLKLAKFMKEE